MAGRAEDVRPSQLEPVGLDDGGRGLQQAHRREAGDRLARAALPDDPEALLGGEVQGDAAHGLDQPADLPESDRKAADIQEILLAARRHGPGSLNRLGRHGQPPRRPPPR